MMDAIRSRFDNWIRFKFGSLPKIQKFLLEHERRELCLKNLCHQIQMIEIRKGRAMSAEGLSEMVDMTARMFASNALTVKEQSLMSDIEKRKIVEDSMDYKLEEFEGEQKEKRKFYNIVEDDKSI